MSVISIDSDTEDSDVSPVESPSSPVAVIQPNNEERSYFFETPEQDRPIQSIEAIQPWAEPAADDDSDIEIVEVRNITRRLSITDTGTKSVALNREPVKKEEPAEKKEPVDNMGLRMKQEHARSSHGLPARSAEREAPEDPRRLETLTEMAADQPVEPPHQLMAQDEHIQDKQIKRNNEPIFQFQKGRNAKGEPYFTVSRVVAGAGIKFRNLPDLPGAETRKAWFTARQAFAGKAVLGALVYLDRRGPVILKTATSANVGHASRIMGGAAPPAQLLWKPIWRKRIVKLAPLLKLKIGSIFDGQGRKNAGSMEAQYGQYHSSHVEKKLAVYLLYTLLAEQGVVIAGTYATCEDIRKLRRAVQADPRHMRFEILISRKWCTSCRVFVERLSSASGIDVVLKVQPLVEELPPPKSNLRGVVRMVDEARDDGRQGGRDGVLASGGGSEDAFGDAELYAYSAMDVDAGEDDEEPSEDDKSLPPAILDAAIPGHNDGEPWEPSVQRQHTSAPSEPSAFVPQDEEGNELFCPLHPSPRPPRPSLEIKEEPHEAQDTEMTGVALTEHEEAVLFGTPAPPIQAPRASIPRMPSIQHQSKRSESFMLAIRSTKSASAFPLPRLPDEGDELFLPLHDDKHQRPRTPSAPRSPTRDPEPRTPTRERSTEVILIEDSPPPVSEATVARFAALKRAHLYEPPRESVRRPGKPMSIEVARERVFQRKPLPATPVTEEPFAARAAGERDRAAPRRHRVRERVTFDEHDDPVFHQLEMEMEY